MGATVIRSSGSEGAILWKCEHVRMDFCRCSLNLAHYQRRSESGVFPARRYVRERGSGGSPPGALSAPKGEWPYTEATPSEAAPTSPPEGVFRHKRRMELDGPSGRITGRLGLGIHGPTIAYAIGGTATLALRYSIISATAAARTLPPG